MSLLNNDDLDFSIDEENLLTSDKTTNDELASKADVVKKNLEKQ